MDRIFGEWLNAYAQRARARGISDAVISHALDGLTFDPDVVSRDRNQAEHVRAIWEYLDAAVSDARNTAGREALAQHNDLLTRIETAYRVPKEIVTAIWGLESNYGTDRGDIPTIRALATLAADGRRVTLFEAQLDAALKILEAGDIAQDAMRGSWAGAMGHTQFMPTSYLDRAVDFDGDGRRDIWSDDPTDALASAAAYLAEAGWKAGVPWGIEVSLPRDFDYRLAGRDVTRDCSEWRKTGALQVDGKALPSLGPTSIILPGGHEGPAFLISRNFAALRSYNAADSYVIAVGHLADRIVGPAPFHQPWPRHHRALSHAGMKELQERLTVAGFDTKGADGWTGPNTVAALRDWQEAVGRAPDGFACRAVLDVLRRSP